MRDVSFDEAVTVVIEGVKKMWPNVKVDGLEQLVAAIVKSTCGIRYFTQLLYIPREVHMHSLPPNFDVILPEDWD